MSNPPAVFFLALGMALASGCAPNTDVYEACSKAVTARNECLDEAQPDTAAYYTFDGLCGRWEGAQNSVDADMFDCMRRYYNTANCDNHFPSDDDLFIECD